MEALISSFAKLLSFFDPTSDDFILNQLWQFFTTLLNYLNPFSENFILLRLWDFFETLIGYINPFSENFILLKLWDFLANILSYINPFHENFFGHRLIDLLKTLLYELFVPSQESIENLFGPIQEKFAFIDEIKIYITQLQDMFESVEEAPSLTINVNSKYYEGDLKILDLSFFAPYKKYSDMLITAFVYILFAWRLITHLPAIINGFAVGAQETSAYVADFRTSMARIERQARRKSR